MFGWNVEWLIVTQIALTAVIGLISFVLQRSYSQRLNKRLEEFKTDLQLNAFARRAWWELKAKAYSETIASLVDLQYCLERWRDAEYSEKDYNEVKKTEPELYETYLQARKSLMKAVAAGAYVVSEDTITALQEMLRELDQAYRVSGNHLEVAELRSGAAREAMAKVREYAKVDLRAD